MIRPINIAVSPNLEFDDFLLAFKVLLFGSQKGSVKQVQSWFKNYFGRNYEAFAFNSGRSAQWAILKAIGIGKGDQVIVPEFTCVAVPNSVIWLGGEPIYAKKDSHGYNLDPKDVARKITPKTKAIIIQHTFGQPADVNALLRIAKQHNLQVIEDCAHALGAVYQGKPVGSFADAAFFSFGRDKIVSSVFGGVAISKNKNLKDRLKIIQQALPLNSRAWIIQQLLHPLITALALSTYNLFKIGRLELLLAQKLHLISKAVYAQENNHLRPKCFPAQYSDQLATLALNQLEKLSRFNKHRQAVAQIYFSVLNAAAVILPVNDPGSVYLRFTIKTPRAKQVFTKAKQKGVLLGNWYGGKEELNLPTYPTLSIKQAHLLAKKILTWLQ